jgi:ornithine cyclodeaminase/alanine dehydrogenase-like protein (mu-crystallin family)
MKLKVLTSADLLGLVTMTEAAQATKAAFAQLSGGGASAPPRGHVEVGPVGGKTLLMGAYVPGFGLGSKIVSYFPENRSRGEAAIHGLVLLLDERSGVPIGLCDGTSLTAFRTGAATCAAIQLLAREDSKRGALFGTGGQATMQLRAMVSARPLETVRVAATSRAKAEDFVARLQPEVNARLEAADSPQHAVEGADVIVTATSSATPVFSGKDIAPGCHITAIGSITPRMREVDDETLRGASIFVDSVPGVLTEAGELLHAVSNGTTQSEHWVELGAVVSGERQGRVSAQQRTYFKSVGHAVQDVAVARLCFNRASERGLGRDLEL